MPVVLSVHGGCQLRRRLCCTAVQETCTSKYVCFGWFNVLLRKCCTAVVEMFTYLQTSQQLTASVHRPPASAYSNPPEPQKKRNLTFCGAGVPDEHNDANPTHNVMNTHTHTHTLASVVQQSQKHLRPLEASILLWIKVWGLWTLLIWIKVWDSRPILIGIKVWDFRTLLIGIKVCEKALLFN